MAGLMRRRRLLGGALAIGGGAVVGPLLWRQPGFAATPPSGVHVTYGADPGREMVVSWSTPESVANPRLLLGDTSGQLSELIAVESRPSPGWRQCSITPG